MIRITLAAVIFSALLVGCSVDSDVTRSDAAKNQEEFSQANYEKAMIAAGKGKELEEEKKRNAAHLGGQ